MKKVIFLLLVSLILNSCSNSFIPEFNDYDILQIGNIDQIERKYDWRSELSSICKEHETVLKKSGLQLKGFSEIYKDCLSHNEILNQNSLFPAYYKADSLILMPYEWLKSDTTTTHVKINCITNYIDSLLHTEVSYKYVSLKWNYKGHCFESIALFNSITGELEYDNILFNLIGNIEFTASKTKNPLIYRSENQETYELQTHELSYYNPETNNTSYATITCREYGSYTYLLKVIHGDSIYVRTYNHYCIDHNYVVNGYDCLIYQIVDLTPTYTDYIEYTISAWLGCNISYAPIYPTSTYSDVHGSAIFAHKYFDIP